MCSVDRVVDDLGRPETSCGSFASSWQTMTDSEGYGAAHDCLIAAFEAKQPVIATWSTTGIDSKSEGAWIGLARDGGYQVYLATGAIALSPESTLTRRCPTIVDLGACSSYTSTLCLSCAQPSTEAQCGQ